MAELVPISLGPWMGIDNVHLPDAGVFQPRGELEKRLPALSQAVDVDLDDDGWPSTRLPAAAVEVLGQGIGGWEVDERFFIQDGTSLYEVTDTKTLLLSGLAGRALLCGHWGKIYITDGVQCWILNGEIVEAWGLPTPELTLSPAAGQLVTGTYAVQCAFVDAQGNEGGVSDFEVVTLSAATGIQVSLSGDSPLCAGANIYVSQRDQKQTTYFATAPIGAFPYTIQTASNTKADPPKTAQMSGPILGASGLFSFRAFLLMWRDGVVFRSEAAEPHLFHGENFMQFGATIQACEGVAGGMWIGTTKGLWWVQGEDPAGWIPVQKTFDAVARGSKKLQGRKLPRTGTDGLVALFVTASGLVVGMPDGTVLHLTDGVYAFDTATRVSFAYVERNNLRQIITNLVNDNGS